MFKEKDRFKSTKELIRKKKGEKMSLKNKIKMFSVSESGRSMVEMLGVLAIIGVLSIGAVAGYKFALNKFRANEIINELNARALSVSARMLSATTPYESDEVIEDGFGNTLAAGYSAKSRVSCINPEYFDITVCDIPSEVCTQILRDYETPIMIFVSEAECEDETHCVDGERYNNDTGVCYTETGTVKMIFNYRNDLGERETCSERGYFGEEDFICHCSGNTYIDPDNPNECLCPAGTIWSAESGEHGECIESICDEGYFESKTNGCVPCDDEATYTVDGDTTHQSLCRACRDTSGRQSREVFVATDGTYRCANINDNCDGFRNWQGVCYSCSQETYVYGMSDQVRQSCVDCKNRSVMESWCVNNDWCPDDGRHLFQFDLSQGSGLSCVSCDATWEPVIWSGSSTKDHGMISRCSKCRDANGNLNRAVKRKNGKDYCGFRNCTSTQFKSETGACYDCTHVNQVYVGTDEALKASCVACGNREVTSDGYCRIADCGAGVGLRMKDGTCYPCDHYIRNTTHIYLNQMENPENCELCTGRVARDGICYNDAVCGAGTGWWLGGSTSAICYGCDEKRVTKCSTYGCELCDSCEGQHATTANWCVLDNACNDTSKFQDKTNGCIDCAYTQKVDIGTHDVERNHCLNCTGTKRFWAGSYCYRCDTSEMPDVITEEEIAGCTSCPQREVKDGKCVLKQ